LKHKWGGYSEKGKKIENLQNKKNEALKESVQVKLIFRSKDLKEGVVATTLAQGFTPNFKKIRCVDVNY
jgi:hypothetical protein